MPAPLSLDHRERVAAVRRDEGLSLKALAERFLLSVTTVNRWLARLRNTGSVAPAPHGGGHPHAIPDEALGLLLTLVEAHADATLEELRDDYQCCTDQRVGRSTIDRALDRLGLTRKKKVLRASERDRPDVQQRYEQFQQEVQQIPVEHLKFLDESGSHISLTRTHARATRGERVSDSVPRNRGRVETMLGLLSLQGMEGVMTVEGGTNKEVFVTFLKTQVLPRLQPKDVLVMDNLKAHRAPGIQELVEETGAKVLYMPPYLAPGPKNGVHFTDHQGKREEGSGGGSGGGSGAGPGARRRRHLCRRPRLPLSRQDSQGPRVRRVTVSWRSISLGAAAGPPSPQAANEIWSLFGPTASNQACLRPLNKASLA